MMLNRRLLLLGASLAALPAGVLGRRAQAGESFPLTHTDEEWRKLLTPDQYAVLRKRGTEYPYSSALLKEHRKGLFACAGCGQDAFPSETKFESGTGWPSFWAPLKGDAIATTGDATLGMLRMEVHCSRCGGHLGHVFDDGPKPTGLRYCLNGVALAFHPATA
jgi:peptide-methionine (R)-S-oxide reductase